MSRKVTLRALLAVAAVLVVVAGAGLAAHHGWTGYDEQKALTLTGTVKAVAITNPHGYVDLVTKDKTWHIVLAPPSRMEARGLTAEMIKPGTTVTVMGYPHKQIATELRAENITVADKKTELR